MDLAIEVRGLVKKYADVTAVDNINFQVKKGEIFGFLGPNGAGKTTTQRILTGVITATSGEAFILGYDIRRETFYAKSRIGVVPESANIYIDLSAWDNLMLIGQLYDVSEKDRIKKAVKLLTIFNLCERKDEKTKIFSKGMKQKLLLCMALMHNPRILFLDEPTSGLDVVSSRLIRKMISEFSREGITIFLTTHNIQEADGLCDRIAVIDHGQIATIDTPENLKKKFQSDLEEVFVKITEEHKGWNYEKEKSLSNPV